MNTPTLLEYLTHKTAVVTYFSHESDAYQFHQELQRYGLIAFEKLPANTQHELMESYFQVYFKPPVK